MSRLGCLFAVWALALNSASAHAAPVSVTAGYISLLQGGWVEPYLRVQLANVPNINPDSCPVADGYITSPADTGNALFNSMLLSAYMANKRVELTIDGCAGQRPRIISVVILPN